VVYDRSLFCIRLFDIDTLKESPCAARVSYLKVSAQPPLLQQGVAIRPVASPQRSCVRFTLDDFTAVDRCGLLHAYNTSG
jgi:hypothetical protein